MLSWWGIIWDIRTGNVLVKSRKAVALPSVCLIVLPLLLSVCGSALASSEGLPGENPPGMHGFVPNGGVSSGKPVVITENKGKDQNSLIINPDGNFDSTGIPSLGDVFEFIDKNPEKAGELLQDPAKWPYLAVAAGIIASRETVMANYGRPIPAHLRKTLSRWYPDDMLNVVRWTSMQGPLKQFLQEAKMNFAADTLAITVMDAVIFRNDNLADDGALWAHELYHVQQYREWGVFGFAKRWVENASVDGPIEAPAYAREAEARPFFAP